jgi:spore germination cell wall hydrolase CwlJ-like protein
LRRILSITTVGGIALALATAGLATDAWSERAGGRASAATVASMPKADDVITTPATRRAQLEARLQSMILAGEGGRLNDRKTVPVRPPISPARKPDAQRAPPVSSVRETAQFPSIVEPMGNIQPPATTSPARAARAGGYRAPHLDLRTPPVVPQNDIECLTQAIYYEARNESEDGQAAVAEVVLNRSRAGSYPRKVCDVVYQRNSRTCQFTFTCDGSIGRGPVNMTAWRRAERIARAVHEGRSPSLLPRNSVNYHANYVRPSWGRRLERVRQIGAHIFYGSARNGQATPGAVQPRTSEPISSGLMFVRNTALDDAYAAASKPVQPVDGPPPA